MLSSVGSNGYSWSSSSDDSGDHYRGMHLHFHVTWLYPNDALYRVYGFQLRCLSE